MNFPSQLFIDVPSGKDNLVYSVRARGSFIREPRVGNTIMLYELPCDSNGRGLVLEIDRVQEDLGDEFLFVRFERIDVSETLLTATPEVVAEQIAAALTSAGWRLCDDSGNYLAAT